MCDIAGCTYMTDTQYKYTNVTASVVSLACWLASLTPQARFANAAGQARFARKATAGSHRSHAGSLARAAGSHALLLARNAHMPAHFGLAVGSRRGRAPLAPRARGARAPGVRRAPRQ